MSRSEEIIKKDIVDELFWDSRIDASNIKVTVNECVAKLSGEVPSYRDLIIAKSDAQGINGVADVTDDIIINHPSPPALPTDNEVKARAANMLTLDPFRRNRFQSVSK